MNGVSYDGNGRNGAATGSRQREATNAAHAPAHSLLLPAIAQQHPMTREQRTDEQLLGDYQHGDRESFATLVSRYQRELFHFLVRFLGDRAAAEDVFQETFLQIHHASGRGCSPLPQTRRAT
jgi:hypothetical protein